MSTSPIDVVVPLYNNERYIARAVRSVLTQTVPPARLVIVDDGSTDGGATVVKELINSHTGPTQVRLLQQANGGPNAARNAGLRAGDAPYVAFLDADDVWEPTKLERQLACFTAGPAELVMVYVLTYGLDAEDRRTSGPAMYRKGPLRGRIFEQLLEVNLIAGSASSVMLRRAVLERSGLFDEGLRGFEDIDLWLRVSREGTVDVVEEALVGLRTHATNAQRDTTFMLREMLAFYTKWFPEARSRPTVLRMWAHLIAEFTRKAKDPAAARRMVVTSLPPDMRRALFRRTFGSVWLHVFLKRLRAPSA